MHTFPQTHQTAQILLATKGEPDARVGLFWQNSSGHISQNRRGELTQQGKNRHLIFISKQSRNGEETRKRLEVNGEIVPEHSPKLSQRLLVRGSKLINDEMGDSVLYGTTHVTPTTHSLSPKVAQRIQQSAWGRNSAEHFISRRL